MKTKLVEEMVDGSILQLTSQSQIGNEKKNFAKHFQKLF